MEGSARTDEAFIKASGRLVAYIQIKSYKEELVSCYWWTNNRRSDWLLYLPFLTTINKWGSDVRGQTGIHTPLHRVLLIGNGRVLLLVGS
jgi:hypothetical protein